MLRIPLKQDENLQLNNRQYTIDKVIGRGATCIVYSAYYKDSINHRHYVNIKECYPHNVGITRKGQMLCWKSLEEKSQHIAEFHKAYDKVVLCQNGNYTVHAFDIFECNNTAYIIMDANDGVTFDNDCSDKLVDILTTVKLLTHVVGEYHKNGYLHLDIKPINFFVYPRPSNHIILFDMDTITSMEDIANGNVNSVAYSDGWAAPEQKQGKLSKLCPATDIYAIGAILFEKVMGRSVEPADMSVFADWEFDNERFEKVNPKIKRLLRIIFRKTLSANRKRRFQFCNELIEILEEAIRILSAGEPYLVHSCPASLDNFIGRNQELEEIHAILEKENSVFVYGVGGTGKTELAIKYAEQYKDEFNTVVFCRYDTSLISTLRKIAIKNMDYSDAEYKCSDDDFIMKELPKLCDDRTLLILDNFNVDVDQEEQLENFIALNCKKIITTRTDFSGINASVYKLNNLDDEDCFKLFRTHSQMESLTKENKALITDICEYIAYNTYFITILAKRMYEKGISLDTLYTDVKANLLRKPGKIVAYKDGKQINETVYKIAKILFNTEKLSEEELQVLRNLYMLRWRTLTVEQYRKIACFGMDDDSVENEVDSLNKLERLGWVLNSGGASRQIRLHPIVLDLIFEEFHPSVVTCPEIATYHRNELKEVVPVNENDSSLYSGFKKRKYLELFFEFCMSLDITNKSNFEYMIDSIHVSYVQTFRSSFIITELLHKFLFSKNFAKTLNVCDSTIGFKVRSIKIWFILDSICSGYWSCDHHLPKWEKPAIDLLAEAYNHCLNNPSNENINYFVEGVMLFSQYFKLLYEDDILTDLSTEATWTFKKKEFLQIKKYIRSLNKHMTPEQKEICKESFSHHLKQLIKAKKSSQKNSHVYSFEELEKVKSDYEPPVESFGEKTKAVLSDVMEDDTLSLSDKRKQVQSYFSEYDAYSLRHYHHFGTVGKGKESEGDKHKYILLKEFLSKYGHVFDESTEDANYLRHIYLPLSLKYDIEEFHANMKIYMKQLKRRANHMILSKRSVFEILVPFEVMCDSLTPEDIDAQLVSKHVLPYATDYLAFCESLLNNNGVNKNDWYVAVYTSLEIYSQGVYGSVFLPLFKEYEKKYNDCIGLDYELIKTK